MRKNMFKFFDVSSLCFNPYLTDKRQPPRPKELRQDSYDIDFDYGIIFADIFFDATEKYLVHCIGAPLYHMNDLIREESFWMRNSLNVSESSYLKHITYDQPKISFKELDRASHFYFNYKMLLKPKFMQTNRYGDIKFNIINQNSSELLRNKRVVLFKNKDNKFEWVRDYCNYYDKIHKADAVLIYDSSELYSSKELLEYLKANVNISIFVVRWPVPYGPLASKGSYWDSDYSIYVVYEHAKYRFLRCAKSVLYVDIDELVVSKNNQSIFEYTEKLGKTVYFDGRWVANTCSSDIYSFKDMSYLYRIGDKDRATIKWCTVIDPSKDHIQWRCHYHYDTETKQVTIEDLDTNFETRHFVAITSGWRSKLRFDKILDTSNFDDCEILHNVFRKMGWE
ncbi:hypothetical protein [Campylobacter aviculae]|uniref:Glycosyltransferase family 92 protein n=1 Tax=Campylobacter aviculae TaxID=2510190 RepID=A0A4U7BJP8_9BACT|nr:hypothetical protein [Campylobacter aviculae]TKX32198.1 hypothetical protein CQA76_04725 [Campylobacter aviculae]